MEKELIEERHWSSVLEWRKLIREEFQLDRLLKRCWMSQQSIIIPVAKACQSSLDFPCLRIISKMLILTNVSEETTNWHDCGEPTSDPGGINGIVLLSNWLHVRKTTTLAPLSYSIPTSILIIFHERNSFVPKEVDLSIATSIDKEIGRSRKNSFCEASAFLTDKKRSVYLVKRLMKYLIFIPK